MDHKLTAAQALSRRDWREVVLSSFVRRRLGDDLLAGLSAAFGGLLGLLVGSGLLILLSAPQAPLRPASGAVLLIRLSLFVPPSALLGARLGLRLGGRYAARR